MKKQNPSSSPKLVLSKTTVRDLTMQTGIKAGGCSKNWSYAPSHGADGCRGGTKAQ